MTARMTRTTPDGWEGVYPMSDKEIEDLAQRQAERVRFGGCWPCCCHQPQLFDGLRWCCSCAESCPDCDCSEDEPRA